MKAVLLISGTLAMFFAEIFLLYLWFTKRYLKNKNMSLGQILKRSKKLYSLTYRIKKYYVWPEWNLYCFLEDHKQVYGSLVMDFIGLCGCECLFVFVSFLDVFLADHGIMDHIMIEILLCGGAFGMLCYLILGNEAELSTTLDLYIKFLTELEMAYGEEVDSLIKETITREKTEANRERFLANALYQNKKYERYMDNEIPPEDEKWFDKKMFWLLLCVIALIAGGFYMFYESGPLIALFTGREEPLSFPWKSRLDGVIGGIFVTEFVIMWVITNRKNPKRFDFIKRAYNRVLISLFGPEDLRVRVSKDLWPWNDKIMRMSRKLNIKGVRIERCFNSQDVAVICQDEDGVQVVLLDQYQMEAIKKFFLQHSWNTYHDAILFIIGHELAHIHFKDISARKSAVNGLLIWLGSLVYMIGGGYLLLTLGITNDCIYFLWTVSVLALVVFVTTPMSDDRYWAQVQELRADRVSMSVLGLHREVFWQLAFYFRENGMAKADKSHPSMDARCEELAGHNAWTVWDYIRYSVRFRVNRLLRRSSVL